MYFLLPFKGIGGAKSRWSALGERRQDLVLKLLGQNLQTVTAVAGNERVFLVSPDRASLEHFHTYQSIQTSGAGLNQDLSEALTRLQSERPPASLCVLLPDLPALTTDEVNRLLQSVESADVALCPDENDYGTNAMVVRDWNALDFLFEGASFERHLEACREHALEHNVIRSEGLARDCDNLDDLERFCLI
jgi:2-phospho-L-lactate guanylyltransferase